MVRLEIVQRKLAELDDRVARVRAHRRASRDELASDRDALDLVAFNLMLAVQAACDLAAHLIADEGFRNIVAHGYAGIDIAATHAASTAGLDDLDRFAREIATWLARRPG